MRDDSDMVMGVVAIIVAMAIALAPMAMAAYETQRAFDVCRETHSYDTCASTLWR